MMPLYADVSPFVAAALALGTAIAIAFGQALARAFVAFVGGGDSAPPPSVRPRSEAHGGDPST